MSMYISEVEERDQISCWAWASQATRMAVINRSSGNIREQNKHFDHDQGQYSPCGVASVGGSRQSENKCLCDAKFSRCLVPLYRLLVDLACTKHQQITSKHPYSNLQYRASICWTTSVMFYFKGAHWSN